ncbi:unnamed protein product [Didymodactylos carnosus]|uniref:Tetratricopeptide repeat protein n=1 Tax=Didymodactylos carnosus TaxID=1234261 RepID=A0A815UAL8_9BILA|nr:unnamed protein product [Didymodactylos carnosus]CAF1511396.1 unnamed protein product [Didymodactylos carnosus]CAF3718138.1 unnamed protein product [Didymodactylos carnosus]CAF4372067.1 unnamed protein product [Didymodactylos carnosus]
MDKAFTLDILSLIAFLEDDEEQTIELTQHSLEIKRTYVCQDHPCIALDLATLGNILKELGRHDEAMAHYTEAITIYEHLKADRHPGTAVILHGLGFIHCAKKDYNIALSYYLKAQTVYEKYFTTNDPNRIRLLLSIAEVYQLQGDLHLVIDALKHCLTTIQSSHPIDKLLLGRTYMMLADTYMLEGNTVAALYQYEKGLSIEVDHDIDHYVYYVGYHLLMLSCNLKSQGLLQQAQMMYKNASIIFQQLDKLNLFDLVEKLIKLSTNDSLKDELLSFPESLQKNAFKDAMDIIDILSKAASLPSHHVEVLSIKDQILYYYFSMALYQQLFMNIKHRATALILLGSHYEKYHQKDLAQHCYVLAESVYKELVAYSASATDSTDLTDVLNNITIRIESLTM